MSVNFEQTVADIVTRLEKAWNAADGDAFAQPFTEDADFVNIRGDHFRTRQVIAKGHQAIFDTIYKGSTVRYRVKGARMIAPSVLLAQVNATLKAPTGPLAGEHNSLFTLILLQDGNDWRVTAFHNTLITP